MAISKKVLGMNARNFLYIRKYNRLANYYVADDKLETKKMLLANGIPAADLYAEFSSREDIKGFDWKLLPESGFAIKPARGWGGGGILPIKDWSGEHGVSFSGEEYTVDNLENHVLDILEGAYSLQYLPDRAFIEERLTENPFFKKIKAVGIPDIRIIVLNGVPVMAMMRLPTRESGGKANLHQGALALGIDIKTGITTSAVWHDKVIHYIPETKIKVQGIRIPEWDTLLLMAAKTQLASGLGYVGVDLVIDGKKGPLILELNARPGLSIQIANLASLRTRLERIENMDIPTAERGVEVAKSLFAAPFATKVQIEKKVLGIIEPVKIITENTQKTVDAKMDTGAFRSSIDLNLAKELNVPLDGDRKVFIKSASGQKFRPLVNVTLELAGRKITTDVSVVDRSHLAYQIIVGRKDLKGFMIDPERSMPDETPEVYENDKKITA
jgi:alpha-L-glutamate ligase-like protein